MHFSVNTEWYFINFIWLIWFQWIESPFFKQEKIIPFVLDIFENFNSETIAILIYEFEKFRNQQIKIFVCK